MLNSLSNDKFLDWPKLKVFADKKTNVTQKLNFFSGRVENIVGKGENAGYQHEGYLYFMLNSLPNNKFLDRSKLKAFADKKIM